MKVTRTIQITGCDCGHNCGCVGLVDVKTGVRCTTARGNAKILLGASGYGKYRLTVERTSRKQLRDGERELFIGLRYGRVAVTRALPGSPEPIWPGMPMCLAGFRAVFGWAPKAGEPDHVRVLVAFKRIKARKKRKVAAPGNHLNEENPGAKKG